ncbi:hypothetical protein BH10ACT3_BH10ACT3_02820 [soil metagenome]
MGNTVTYKQINADESEAVFDRAAKRLLGITGTEFTRRLEAGEYDECTDVDVMQVAMLKPVGR